MLNVRLVVTIPLDCASLSTRKFFFCNHVCKKHLFNNTCLGGDLSKREQYGENTVPAMMHWSVYDTFRKRKIDRSFKSDSKSLILTYLFWDESREQGRLYYLR